MKIASLTHPATEAIPYACNSTVEFAAHQVLHCPGLKAHWQGNLWVSTLILPCGYRYDIMGGGPTYKHMLEAKNLKTMCLNL